MEVQGDSKATELFWVSSQEQNAFVLDIITGLMLTAILVNILEFALRNKHVLVHQTLCGCVDIGDTSMLVTEAWR